jgi:hypothetical protein
MLAAGGLVDSPRRLRLRPGMTTLEHRPRTALVVIDVQNDVVGGAHERDAVVANIGSLVARARAEQVPVVWVQHSDDGLEHGSDGWRIVPELEPDPCEPLVEKSYGDSFEDTRLEDVLAELEVGRLLVTGAQTDACIRSTLHGALAAGYDATLVSDAHTTEDQSQWGAPRRTWSSPTPTSTGPTRRRPGGRRHGPRPSRSRSADVTLTSSSSGPASPASSPPPSSPPRAAPSPSSTRRAERPGRQAFWSSAGCSSSTPRAAPACGVKDSLELAWSDWQGSAQFDRLDDQDSWAVQWARAYVEWAAGEERDWLVSRGITLTPVVGWAERGDLRADGHGSSVPASTSHGAPARGSSSRSSAPRTKLPARGQLRFHHRHRVDDLVLHDGTATGVRGTLLAPDDRPRGRATSRQAVGQFELSASAVIVTTGGLGADHDLVRRWWPERLGTPPRSMVTGVPAYDDGRMLDMAAAAGVSLVNRNRMWHYTDGVQGWARIRPSHGIRILPGPSSMWFDALGRRLPAPCLPGYDTLSALRHLRATPDLVEHDHSWFVRTQKIIQKEFGLSGFEQNPDITGATCSHGHWTWTARRSPGSKTPVRSPASAAVASTATTPSRAPSSAAACSADARPDGRRGPRPSAEASPLGGLRSRLQPGAVGAPPGLVLLGQVRAAGTHPRRTVQQLADEIGVPGVPVRLGHEVDEDLVEGDVTAAGPPPRDDPERVERQRRHGRLGVHAHPLVAPQHRRSRLVGGRPHVGVRLGVVLEPRQPLREGPAEDVAEVARLDARDVLDQPEQVGPRRHDRPPRIALGQAVELPQQRLPPGRQREQQVRLVVVLDRHGGQPPSRVRQSPGPTG